MMMTEKYYTLPSSSSFSYSTLYHSPTKNRLDFQKKTSTNMKLLFEQQPILQTHSLYDIHQHIDDFEKNSKDKETLQSVIANTLQQTFFNHESYGSTLSRTMMNTAITGKRRSLSSSYLIPDKKPSNRYCSALSKRTRTYSLTNNSTMVLTASTSFSEEQTTEPQETTSNDYENTYFYPEETTRFDDALSLTTITSNFLMNKKTNTQHDISICSDATISQSDTDDNSESTTPADFTGVVHAKKCTIVEEKECLSDYDNKIMSNADNVSLNKSMTLSIEDEYCPRILLDKRTNDDYNKVDQQPIDHSIKMIAYDDDDDDGHYSDQSHYSDDLRYSSDAARSSCASDDLNNTSSTLRQEAISITRVRCKRRKTWIRSPSSPTRSSNNTKPISYLQQRRLKTNLIQPFLSNNQVDGTDARQNASVNSTATTKPISSTILNQTRVKATVAAMLLHNNSLNCNNNKKIKNGESSSYNFVSLNDDHHSIKTDDAPLSSILKTNPTLDKDASLPKTDEFYESSLNTVKRLLNESLDSNIEIIQMDEQECIFEIVNGVLTIVPKDKSTSSSISSDGDKKIEEKKTKHSKSSKHQKRRSSSSAASSLSTPSLSEQEHERDEFSSTSSSRLSSKPFVTLQDTSIKKHSSPPLQTEQSADVLDLFSTPIISINPINKNQKNLLDDSLSSVSSYGDHSSQTKKQQSSIPRSSSPINHRPKSSSIKDTPSPSIENQTRSNKNNVLGELLKTVKKAAPVVETDSDKPKFDHPIPKTAKKSPPPSNGTDIEQSKYDYPLPKPEPPPAPKPINKARISEFASLLSSSVHLTQPQPIKQSPTTKPRASPSRSEDQSFSSVPSASTDRDERESFHTVKSITSEQEQPKRHIDARFTEKIDDRGSIQINTANIKALFEQKISDTNKALSQSKEQLAHSTEVRQQQQQHRKIPVSYGSLTRTLPNYQPTLPTNPRRKSHNDSATMNKYSDHMADTKDVVIIDKSPENGHVSNIRRNTTELAIRPTIHSSSNSPVSSINGYYSETLIAREIRETKEKEEELKRQRKKCGLAEDGSSVMSQSMNDSIKSESTSSTATTTATQPVKSSSFLSNLDFFTSKLNGSSNESTMTNTSPRRSSISVSNCIYDTNNSSQTNSNRRSSHDELKQMNNVVSQELNRFNENGIPIIRSSSTNGLLRRSTSNQNILSAQNTNNIIQREIEIIRAKEAELRQLGRIQRTSDEHADPRKYQELVSTLPKSQSINTIPTGKIRRDSESQQLSRHNGPMTATTNGFLKSKTNNNNHSNNSTIAAGRGKFSSPNPTVPVVSSSNKSADHSKLSTIDRLELEKRECQEREQELRKQRNSVSTSISSTNTTINGDSGNVSQEEHDDDQERYFDKIERLKRTENQKAQAPLVRPTKKLDMSQKWEQMMANKIDD